MLCFCPACWARDITIYEVLAAFIFRPVSLLAASKASALTLYYARFRPI